VSEHARRRTWWWAYLAAVVGERHRRAAERLQRNRAVQAKLWPELFPIAPAPPALRPAVPAPRTAYPAGDGGLIRPAAPY